MELAIDELQKRHPNLDRMMCETLLKLHEQGKLTQFISKLEEEPPAQPECVLKDGITIE